MIGTADAARLLRLREIRLGRARRDLTRASLTRRRSEQRAKTDEMLATTLERNRERSATSAHAQLVGMARTSLALELFHRDLEQLAEDCRTATTRAEQSAERRDADAEAQREARRRVHLATIERDGWAGLHERAAAKDRRAEVHHADDEDEAILEGRAVQPP